MINTRNLIGTAFLLTQQNLFLMLTFTFTPLLFPYKLLWRNLNKKFYLVPLAFFTSTSMSFLSSNVALLKLLFIKIFCPFNLLPFGVIFVFSLHRNNFTTIFHGLLVLLFLLLSFTLCAFQYYPIPVSGKTYLGTFFAVIHISPFVSFVQSIIILFR